MLPSLVGRVVASHGRDATVVGEDGARVHCRLQGRRLTVVCGDRVRWRAGRTEGGAGIIVDVLPRARLLARISSRGDPEPVAANLTQLVAVVAPVPSPDFGLCDRYLAAAEWNGLSACVVANKCDLDDASASLDARSRTTRESAIRCCARASGSWAAWTPCANASRAR